MIAWRLGSNGGAAYWAGAGMDGIAGGGCGDGGAGADAFRLDDVDAAALSAAAELELRRAMIAARYLRRAESTASASSCMFAHVQLWTRRASMNLGIS